MQPGHARLFCGPASPRRQQRAQADRLARNAPRFGVRGAGRTYLGRLFTQVSTQVSRKALPSKGLRRSVRPEKSTQVSTQVARKALPSKGLRDFYLGDAESRSRVLRDDRISTRFF